MLILFSEESEIPKLLLELLKSYMVEEEGNYTRRYWVLDAVGSNLKFLIMIILIQKNI